MCCKLIANWKICFHLIKSFSLSLSPVLPKLFNDIKFNVIFRRFHVLSSVQSIFYSYTRGERVSFFNLAFERDHTKSESRTGRNKKLFFAVIAIGRRKIERENVFHVIFLQTFILLNTFMSAASFPVESNPRRLLFGQVIKHFLSAQRP